MRRRLCACGRTFQIDGPVCSRCCASTRYAGLYRKQDVVKRKDMCQCGRAKWKEAKRCKTCACPDRTRTCKGCSQAFVPKRSVYGTFCSRSCAFRWKANEFRIRSEKIKIERQNKRDERIAKKALIEQITRECRQCGNVCILRSGSFCSKACRYQRLAMQLGGKKYSYPNTYSLQCTRCQKNFKTHRNGKSVCAGCVRRANRRGRGKHEQRAKKAGVPYIYGIKPEVVFARDGWRCQLCGVSTPKRLRGIGKENSPELDHITPFAAGGGHTWENVQCACHKCNMAKSTKPLGQLRLVG